MLTFVVSLWQVFFMNLVYEGLLQIHIRLWNPLGFDINGACPPRTLLSRGQNRTDVSQNAVFFIRGLS